MRHTNFLVSVAAIALTGVGAGALPAAAAPWVKGYVVGQYEYAFRYGGRSDFTRGAEIEPGVDCLHGASVHFANDAHTKVAVARQRWRTRKEIDYISAPPGLDDVRAPVLTRFWIWNRALAYRGYKKEIETYVNPWATDDPGQPQVTSSIGDGFNLDGKIKPADFISPDGEKGIDNNLYRAWGCDAPWRGNGNATLDLRANDKMQEGLYTMVIRISGNADPMNDSDAVVEIGYSPDKIVKDARGGIAGGLFLSPAEIGPVHQAQGEDRGRRGGDRTGRPSAHPPHLLVLRPDRRHQFPQGQDQAEARLRRPQSGAGLIGGYRNWRDLYAENTFAQDGGQQGIREHEDHVSLYFAMRRLADGMPNAKTGKNDGISTVYRIKFASAYVVDPDKAMDIPKLVREEDRKEAFEQIKANTIKGAEMRIPQLVPPGTSEFGAGITEGLLEDLPSKEFFLQTLYRQHYPGEDEYGTPPWLIERRRTEGGGSVKKKPTEQPQQPAKPQQQVRTDVTPASTKP